MANQDPCSCITRDKFHLVITYADSNTVVIHDRSQWVSDQGFLSPSFYDLHIKTPDDTTKVVSVNINGAVLGSNEFPDGVQDGVYTFTAPAMGVGCGVEQSQTHFLHPSLTCRLMKARLRAKHTLQKDVEQVADIVAAMAAAAAYHDYETAARLYRVASLKIDALQCDCNCKNDAVL